MTTCIQHNFDEKGDLRVKLTRGNRLTLPQKRWRVFPIETSSLMEDAVQCAVYFDSVLIIALTSQNSGATVDQRNSCSKALSYLLLCW